jgi:predicted CXXCH cytochrome family protein
MKTDKGMSRLARGLVGVAMGAGMVSTAMGAASVSIGVSKHNLSTGGSAGNTHVSAGTAEICVFCHTPHAADVNTAGAPLWNKRLATGGAAFTTYAATNSSTMNAVFATDGQGGGSIGSVSLACLSCHDGAQAMDNMLNAPGSGGYDAAGGGTTGLNYTWVGTGAGATGLMVNAATGLAMLGKDLNNDHPIGIQYCGGGPGTALPAALCNDADFIAPTSGTIGGATVFWVDTGTAGRQKTDMILFNRAFPANGTQSAGTYPSVECASCHDPHNVTNGTFLRVSNAASAVCLACHVK